MYGAKEEKKNKEIYENAVEIPPGPDSFISFRKLWAFTGPGFLMSIAYLDPGNIEGDLQSGAAARYELLWVLLAAHVFGLLLQRFAARVGVVSGYHMAEVAFLYYPKIPRIVLWVMVEIAIIASDMQEVIGTAIALYLLSNQAFDTVMGRRSDYNRRNYRIIVDTFTFLFLDKYGVRKFELFFCFLISIMAVTFGYEFFVAKPEAGEIAKGTLMPWAFSYGREQVLSAVSVVGSVIMPHNLYLHSSLVKSRKIERNWKPAIVEANKYFFIESAFALTCSFFINLLVVSVFSVGFYGKTNLEIRQECFDNDNHMPSYYLNTFPNNTETADADIYRSGVLLGCVFGSAALYIWAVGILAAGQSSTMTGTYAGQYTLEGFLHIHMSRWKRILLTRSVAIVPTILVTIFSSGVAQISSLNDFLNCVQMVQLPFALLPVLTFAADKRLMKEFAMGSFQKVVFFFISVVVMGINYYFLYDYVDDKFGTWYGWTIFGVFAVIYTTFVAYIAIYCCRALGIDLIAPKSEGIGSWFPILNTDRFDAPWQKELRSERAISNHQPEIDVYCL